MKKQNLFRLLAFFMLFGLLLTNVSCSDDDPVQPNDETEELGHDVWESVEFVLREGHLHGVSFHGNPPIPESPWKRVQHIKFERAEDNSIKKSTNDPFYVIGGVQYALEIIYKNKKGEVMNREFATPEMAPIHQHFFTVKEMLNTKTNQVETDTVNLMKYVYRDTDPVDVMLNNYLPNSTDQSKLRVNDPIGLKGYFTFLKPYKSFDMKVTLVHITRGNKFKSDGSTYPFNMPAPYFNTTDLSLDLPVHVFTDMAYDDESYDAQIKDIMKEFNISEEQAKAWQNGERDESSSYWM